MNIKEIEGKWQKAWDEGNAFITDNNSQKPKYYVLEMWFYHSGKCYVGHLRNYSIGDIITRFFRAKGYNVLHILWVGILLAFQLKIRQLLTNYIPEPGLTLILT